jgi:hypothetical protein
MDTGFTQRDDLVVDIHLLVVDIHLPQGWQALEDTLQDGVTTKAPRGSDGVNPSTYWIDRTLAAITRGPVRTVVASGNSTDLVPYNSGLVAHSHHEMFDDQLVERHELVDLLDRWRAVVLDLLQAGSSTP